MTLTLQHPATSPTTTITFDTALISRSRKITRSFQEGTLDGNAAAANAGTSVLELTVAFSFTGDATTSALEKWDQLDTLVADSNEDPMKLTVTEETAAGSKQQSYTGLVFGFVELKDQEGAPDIKKGTFKFVVTSKSAIT